MKEAYGIDVPEKSPDFKELRATVCQDIYAWIYIPNTVIDYPVVQHPTDPSYYLEYNLDGSKGRPGGIFTQNYNKTDFSDRMTVIYGHNMSDGTMFADLHKYEKTDFFEANPYVFIYTEDDLFVYRIFAAHDYTDDHLLFQFDWTVDRVFLDYLGGILGDKDLSGNVDRGAEFDAESRILTLSTCIKGANEKRYLVQGVLLK